MPAEKIVAVTGAFSYTGKYIARELLSRGRRVITLVNQPDAPNPFGKQVEAFPFNFKYPEMLAESLAGAEALYNTYWVRFDRGEASFDKAIANTETLLKAARQSGVRRVVHISVTNADASARLPYFQGKAQVEELVKTSGLSYAILRPALIFGKEEILLHNITWLLRRFPIFGIPGDGEYRLQPIFVEELARLAAEAGERDENVVLDTIGPETYTFHQLVTLLRDAVGSRARLVYLPPRMALLLVKAIGAVVGDVVLTQNELAGLMEGLLETDSSPNAQTRLSDWLQENAAELGRQYVSELKRHHER